MDADCLIKLTKAGLKELVVGNDTIVIPEVVRKEVIDAGKDRGHSDATFIEANVAAKKIQIAKEFAKHSSGDEALVELFRRRRYDAVATDDRKLVRILQGANVPFILPGVILYSLHQRGFIDRETALRHLNQLSQFISDEEYSTVRLLLEGKS